MIKQKSYEIAGHTSTTNITNKKMKEFDPSSPAYTQVDGLDEAEALVTSYPNSAKAWIFYIVYYLQQAEINKARTVARRAIQTINFREDKEKCLIWKAFLNLENQYGTEESLNKVLKEALEFQDQKEIYKHIINVYINAEKTEQLENISQTIFKKFKNDKDVYLTLGTYYMKCGKLKEARNLYTRSLICVDSKKHPDIIGKFAHLEYKHGDIERSFSMFEEILVKYPKRKDLKSIYIQVLRSQGQDERANALL